MYFVYAFFMPKQKKSNNMSSSHTPTEHSPKKHKNRQSLQVDLKILIFLQKNNRETLFMIVSKTWDYWQLVQLWFSIDVDSSWLNALFFFCYRIMNGCEQVSKKIDCWSMKAYYFDVQNAVLRLINYLTIHWKHVQRK